MSSNRPHFPDATFHGPSATLSTPSRAKTWVIALAAAGVTLLLGIVACGGLLYVGATGVSRRPPSDEERQAVLTIDDLAPFGVEPVNQQQREIWQTKRNLDGSLEVEYEYDPERAPTADDTITVMSSVTIDRSESSARETYALAIGAYQLGFGVFGVRARQQSHTMTGVDQSYFASIVKDDQLVGNMVVIRQAKRVHGLLLIGLHFDDPAQLESLLRINIEKSATLSTR
jgi:hypothetical protein